MCHILGWVWIVAVATGLSTSCDRGRDPLIVDFSNTVIIYRPGNESGQDKFLLVAVAAIISPKETLGYYRELLNKGTVDITFK